MLLFNVYMAMSRYCCMCICGLANILSVYIRGTYCVLSVSTLFSWHCLCYGKEVSVFPPSLSNLQFPSPVSAQVLRFGVLCGHVWHFILVWYTWIQVLVFVPWVFLTPVQSPRILSVTLWREVEGRMVLDMTIYSYIEAILQYSLRHNTLHFYKTILGICMFWLFTCLCTMSITDSCGSQGRLSLEFSYR